MFNKMCAFLCGIREFGTDFTTAYTDDNEQECYDYGRTIARRLARLE